MVTSITSVCVVHIQVLFFLSWVPSSLWVNKVDGRCRNGVGGRGQERAGPREAQRGEQQAPVWCRQPCELNRPGRRPCEAGEVSVSGRPAVQLVPRRRSPPATSRWGRRRPHQAPPASRNFVKTLERLLSLPLGIAASFACALEKVSCVFLFRGSRN